MSNEYLHAEAYCLMKYKCENCDTIEIIWNSRDGVTPFITICQKCASGMKHIDWQNDKCVPNHVPQPGDRIFIDNIPEVVRIYIRMKVARLWNHPTVPMKEHFKTQEDAVLQLTNDFQPGQPYLLIL